MSLRARLPLLLLALAACGAEPEEEPAELTAAQVELLRDARYCEECHPDHYREWQSSMHAHSSLDPVFLAMNRRGQRESNGALGDFCLRCHAPAALAAGATSDGLNLEALDPSLHGVTCFFCHTVTAVEGTHNAPLVHDERSGVLFGGLSEPLETHAHGNAFSDLHARTSHDSSKLCGSCHDVVTPSGLQLERTLIEWDETLFSDAEGEEPLSCGACHLPGRPGLAADVPSAPLRRVHDHSMPGVDLPFPDGEAREHQRRLVQELLDTTLAVQLCVGGTAAEVVLENVAAGHSFPSGAAQHRRLWVELQAFAGDRLISPQGVLPLGETPDPVLHPEVWLFGDHLYGADGHEVLMPWEAVTQTSALLPGPTARDPSVPGYTEPHRARSFTFEERPTRVQLRVLLSPFGRAELDSLVATGDLDPAWLAQVPRWSLRSGELTWREEELRYCVP